ncbi:uncharacterized protein LOC103989419 [Musa acuminata AAA Group]|uniref:uncharacterized protein LOC103989419 n=1 Tax=Musa acuminata AAA Group TaxID=214697 RepID=UPI0031E237D1
MEFDGFVHAVSADDELRPGQLYFLLPISMLQRPLSKEEVAALAVRASAALLVARRGARERCVPPLVFHPALRTVAAAVGASGSWRMMGGGKKRVNSKGKRQRLEERKTMAKRKYKHKD